MKRIVCEQAAARTAYEIWVACETPRVAVSLVSGRPDAFVDMTSYRVGPVVWWRGRSLRPDRITPVIRLIKNT